MRLIEVSLRLFRAEPFIGRFPELNPLSPVWGIRTSPKSAYLSDIRVSSESARARR